MSTDFNTSLQYCEVEAIEPMGEGTRVCLDFADVLDPAEGVLLGDSGHGYFLVLSENQPSATYPARPFRVNCGAIHQYIVLGDGRTGYLSELESVASVPVVHAEDYSGRPVPIGRIKMEKRPFVRVVGQYKEQRVSATLQSSDSVRLQTKNRGTVNVCSLKPGDAVLFTPDRPGRHLGQRIEEYIWEK